MSTRTRRRSSKRFDTCGQWSRPWARGGHFDNDRGCPHHSRRVRSRKITERAEESTSEGLDSEKEDALPGCTDKLARHRNLRLRHMQCVCRESVVHRRPQHCPRAHGEYGRKGARPTTFGGHALRSEAISETRTTLRDKDVEGRPRGLSSESERAKQGDTKASDYAGTRGTVSGVQIGPAWGCRAPRPCATSSATRWVSDARARRMSTSRPKAANPLF